MRQQLAFTCHARKNHYPSLCKMAAPHYPSVMPYQILTPSPSPDAPLAQVRLWPYRSLPRRGFVWFIGLTAIMLTLPLFSQLGTPGLWVLLPFLLATIAAIWAALEHSYKTGSVTEDLSFYADRVTLHRYNPRGAPQQWEANPHWVRVSLLPTEGPVPFYLTLSGNQRDVELGAFLTVDERKALYDLVRQRLKPLP